VPRVEGCCPVRSRLRRCAPDLRDCCIGPESRPLPSDCASDLGTAPHVGGQARVPVFRNGPPNGTLAAQVPLWLRHPPPPRMPRALHAQARAGPARAPGTGGRRRWESEPREVDRSDGRQARRPFRTGRGQRRRKPATASAATAAAASTAATTASTSATSPATATSTAAASRLRDRPPATAARLRGAGLLRRDDR
jgi:hypothetical protein